MFSHQKRKSSGLLMQESDNSEELIDLEIKEEEDYGFKSKYLANTLIKDNKFNITVYKNEEFKVTIYSNKELKLREFNEEIIRSLKEKYEEFKDLDDLEVVNYYINSGVEVNIKELGVIPNDLSVELKTEKVWVRSEFNIEMSNYNIKNTALINLPLPIVKDKDRLKLIILKSLLLIWNNSFKDKKEVLRSCFILTRFDINFQKYEDNFSFKEKTNIKFGISVAVNSSFVSMGEIIFRHLKEIGEKYGKNEEWEKLCQLENFAYFKYGKKFMKDFNFMNALIRVSLLGLNTKNKLNIFFSSYEPEFSYKETNNKFNVKIKGKNELNLVILTKEDRTFERSSSIVKGYYGTLKNFMIKKEGSNKHINHIPQKLFNKKTSNDYLSNFIEHEKELILIKQLS